VVLRYGFRKIVRHNFSDPRFSQHPNSQSRVLLSRTVISEGPSRIASPQSPNFAQLAADDDNSDQGDRIKDVVPPSKKLVSLKTASRALNMLVTIHSQKMAPARKTDQDNEKKVSRYLTTPIRQTHLRLQLKRVGNTRKRRN